MRRPQFPTPIMIDLADLEAMRKDQKSAWKRVDEVNDKNWAAREEYYKTGKVQEWYDNRHDWEEG